MSRCTHNDHVSLEPCKNEGIGDHGYCIEHGCCLCGGVMLADTEDWKVYLCHECLFLIVDNDTDCEFKQAQARLEKLIDAAYETGRRSVLGSPLESDEAVEKSR